MSAIFGKIILPKKIADEFAIDEIYDSDDIITHVLRNYGLDEVFGENDLLLWAQSHSPEDIFPASTLEQWAEENGYVKE